MYYFAYGLNLNRRQMAKCCPEAKPLFSATLPNYQLVFAGWSRDWKGGVASVKRAGGEKVLGGVYEISQKDEKTIDRDAGYPGSVDKIKVLVFNDVHGGVEVFTYIVKNTGRPASPSAAYLGIMRQAYIDWGLV